jgi:hypothetical protein
LTGTASYDTSRGIPGWLIQWLFLPMASGYSALVGIGSSGYGIPKAGERF